MIGTFISSRFVRISPCHFDRPIAREFCSEAKLTVLDLKRYLRQQHGYGHVIDDPEKFQTPISLSELPVTVPIKRPPQSWQKIYLDLP